MVAIVRDPDICMGLKLAGVECYNAETVEALPEILEAISPADTGIIAISDEFIELELIQTFLKANPQMLYLAM